MLLFACFVLISALVLPSEERVPPSVLPSGLQWRNDSPMAPLRRYNAADEASMKRMVPTDRNALRIVPSENEREPSVDSRRYLWAGKG